MRKFKQSLKRNPHMKINWSSIDWPNVTKRIKRTQGRIFKLSQGNKREPMRLLQRKLIRSLDAKLLAIKRVTMENKGKHIPGLDKKLYLEPSEKSKLVTKLKLDGTCAPIRKVWVAKPGKIDKKPLGILIIADRVRQALTELALEPEWEAKFDPNSYGFRPGKSCHDAIEAIFKNIHYTGKPNFQPKYVLDANLKKCFDTINHQYLLEKLDTLPEIQNQVEEWLKAGMVEDYLESNKYSKIQSSTITIRTPQRGIISRLLSNIALDGLEKHLENWIGKQPVPELTSRDRRVAKTKSLTVIRYADDFVVMHKDLDILKKAKNEIKKWLEETSKFAFNEDKTRIVRASNGFQFLGFSIILIKRNKTYRTKIYASQESQSRIIQKIGDVCRKNRASSGYQLINLLRPIVLGWGNYYKYTECQKIFSSMDYKIFNILRAWVFRRARKNKGRIETKEKYFPSNQIFEFEGRVYKDNWVFTGQQLGKNGKKLHNFLPKLSWFQSSKDVKVRGSGNSPYDGNHIYWGARLEKDYAFNRRQLHLLKKQN
jgi:RNA-directed DNA polymerase